MGDAYVLQMKNIGKEYSGNPVLKGIDLKVKPGEIHALLGENGAGKSTLMNVLFGMPVIHNTGGYTGEICLDGEKVHISSPKHAMDLGIGMVHQEFMLIPGFAVYENLKLNREVTKPNAVSRVAGKSYESLDNGQMRADTKEALDKVGMDLDTDEMVGELPVGHMQFLEIAREIDKKGVRILVFDEPTAVLNETEASRLLESMKRLAGMGIAIIFITHRLQEVIDVCDTVTILRDGSLVTNCQVKDTDAVQLAEMMVGRNVSYSDISGRVDKFDDSDIVLEFRNFSVDMPGEQVKNIDLKVRRGEIIGIGGLAGQGKLGIPNGAMGLYPASGELLYEGKALPLNHTKKILEKGISFLSEDRKKIGLILSESIEDNMVFNAMQIKREYLFDFKLFSFRNNKKIAEFADQMIHEFDIRCVGRKQQVQNLSGGNQQKVCLAKALALNPKVLFVSEPTRGIDIGAKKLVLDKLKELSWNQGITIILVSSELMELRSICDRIVIVCGGKVADILSPREDDAKFGLAMAGTKAEKEAEKTS
ncbi:sugar ABC transporter ATP-binding protein [Lacrimispora sp. NSJ-141]|uniref:Sugar ABC transporter ATP-binding protein n=1 Tax=Lientehia hominis TaxID=2897778 RepID=A0AAP2WAA7_9FIRM|nr:sugar ABC transporter ATP-binding protein [Lientehia hominis]MCD2493062.1 sugar ABC transporter ATP-binding protein [Lientehia hominis]